MVVLWYAMKTDAKNSVSRPELFQEIVKAFKLELQLNEEPNALSVKVSKGEIILTVVFGDFKKVRIWKKFAFAPAKIMEDYKTAVDLLKPLANAFEINWHTAKQTIASVWPMESQADNNFLLEVVLENLESDKEFLKKFLKDQNRNYLVRKSIQYMLNNWPEFTKKTSSTLLKMLDDAKG